MTRVKSSNICLVRSFAEQKPGGYASVLAQLSGDDRHAIEGLIGSSWSELSLQNRVFAALDRAFGATTTDPIAELARYIAEHDLTRVHRLFLRFRNPAYVLEKSGEYWSRFYDAGSWVVSRPSPTQARGELKGIAERDPIFCRFLQAYIERMFQLSGVQTGICHHVRCVCKGASSCVFDGRWYDEPVKATD